MKHISPHRWPWFSPLQLGTFACSKTKMSNIEDRSGQS